MQPRSLTTSINPDEALWPAIYQSVISGVWEARYCVGTSYFGRILLFRKFNEVALSDT